jgi:hypothetical protein
MNEPKPPAVSTYPPVPDLSRFDFTYRPELKPILKKDIDRDDPYSKYHEVAYYEMPATMFDDLMYVYCDVENKKGPNQYTYFLANEYYEQDEEGPSGEQMECSDRPITMLYLIAYLEYYELQDEYPVASLCQHLYDALEYEALPITKMPEMEIGSEMYPQLSEFYGVLFEYLRCWLNERGEMPELQEFLEVVDYFIDQIKV